LTKTSFSPWRAIFQRIAGVAEGPNPGYSGNGHVDPYVASVLAQEPPEVQRVVVGILTMIKNVARNLRD